MRQSSGGRVVEAYLLSIGVWTVLSLLTGWQYRIFDQSVNLRSTLAEMMLLAEGRGLAFALLAPPVFYTVRRYPFNSRHTLRYLSAYCLGVVPFMAFYACLRWVILPPWNQAQQSFLSRTECTPMDLIREGFADIITIYLATLLAAHAYGYFERIRNQELERSEYEQALAASELQALKMQIHPHFLFNTMHGISTLIDTDGQRAKVMIVKLSSLLRRALEHSGSDLIPLQEELKFVGEYLDIEKMRFGPRLSVALSIAPDTKQVLVPQMILQPLVENAVRYGISGSREKSWIDIVSRRSPKGLDLRISNSVAGNTARGTGLGLRNTVARLNYLYSDEAEFSFEISADRVATAALSLPLLGVSPSVEKHKLIMTENNEREVDHHARVNSR
jgi:two-component system LytT family sensor kinase